MQYAFYAVIEHYGEQDERVLIGLYDEEPDPSEVDEMIMRCMGSQFEYDYAMIEKQYHKE